MSSLAAIPLPFKEPEAHGQPPFSDVARGLASIDGNGPQQLSTDALRDDIRWFAQQQRALEAMMNRWVAELDRRQDQGPEGEPVRCAAWLSNTLNLTSNAAYKQIRTARALDGELRLTAAALRRGEISP